MTDKKRKKKKKWIGLLLCAAALFLILGVFWAVSRTEFQDIVLSDRKSESLGWSYEIRTRNGEISREEPQYSSEYDFILGDGTYEAVKQSRVMTEDLEGASLKIDFTGCGGEVFLDGERLYSDFSNPERDENGYLINPEEVENLRPWRSIVFSLPEDYQGKMLEVFSYYPEESESCYLPYLMLQNPTTVLAANAAGMVYPVLKLAGWAALVLGIGLCMAESLRHNFSLGSLAALFVFYILLFLDNVYRSPVGYYSGFYDWVNKKILPGGAWESEFWGAGFLSCYAVFLLVLYIQDRKKRGRKVPLVQLSVFFLFAFFFTAMQNSTELAGGIFSYPQTVIASVRAGNYVPAVRLGASLVVYVITLLTLTQFFTWRGQEQQRVAALLERGRFARDNYALILQADEESRRRNHEMRHHMQTLYELTRAGEKERAEGYIQSVLTETEKRSGQTYSQNVEINSIVGFPLNQARENGVSVHCQIHVPVNLQIDPVDLSMLLSNMLENALEACLRMKKRDKTYIELKIFKRKSFLFISCKNSVDSEKEKEAETEKTKKKDKRNQGFGLTVMKDVAEKYSGILEMIREAESFTVRTNLCLPEEEISVQD